MAPASLASKFLRRPCRRAVWLPVRSASPARSLRKGNAGLGWLSEACLQERSTREGMNGVNVQGNIREWDDGHKVASLDFARESF